MHSTHFTHCTGSPLHQVEVFLLKPNLKTSRYAIKLVLVSNIVSLDCATATVETSVFAYPGASYYRWLGRKRLRRQGLADFTKQTPEQILHFEHFWALLGSFGHYGLFWALRAL